MTWMLKMTKPMNLIVMLSALTLFSMSGCGGSFRSQGLYDTSIRTVRVPVMVNRTFYRDIERYASEALIKEIQARTPYQVLNSEVADTELRATILSITQDNIASTDPNGLPQTVEVTMVVSFEWKDLRTGKVLRSRDVFQASGMYSPAYLTNERIDRAFYEIADELARDMVTTMQADW